MQLVCWLQCRRVPKRLRGKLSRQLPDMRGLSYWPIPHWLHRNHNRELFRVCYMPHWPIPKRLRRIVSGLVRGMLIGDLQDIVRV